MRRVRVALCQLDTVVGDVDGNVARVLEALGVAEETGCDLVAFPELSLTGYPPEDLLLKPAFVSANLAGLEEVASAARDCAAGRDMRVGTASSSVVKVLGVLSADQRQHQCAELVSPGAVAKIR